MSRHAKLTVCILMIVVGACAPNPAAVPATETSLPPTVTASFTSTSTLTATATPSGTSTITPSPSETPSPTFTFVVLPPTAQPTHRPRHKKTPSETATETATATLACERETASLLLSTSAENVKVGDTVRVTVTVNNEGCVGLGLLQYDLSIQLDGSQPILSPEVPQPVTHPPGVPPGGSDAAEFDLTAVAGGQATLTATVSYEVHLGFPGPAYWGMTSTTIPLIVTVASYP